MTLVSDFFRRAAQHPARTALIDSDGAGVSYGELARMVAAQSGHFRRAGIGAGDRVLVTLKVAVPLYASLYALWSIGAVVVFPEPAMGFTGLRHAARIHIDAWLAPPLWRVIGLLAPELRRIRRGLSPPPGVANDIAADDRATGEVETGDIVTGDIATVAAAAAAVPPEAPALIFFTSGSTGRPKAIVYTHGFILAQVAGLTPLFRPQAGEVDLCAFPLFVLACLNLGSTNVLPNWDLRKPRQAPLDAILAHARRHGVTRMLLQPALCERLVNSDIPPGVRAVLTGGGPVYPDLLRRLAAHVAEVYSVYGSTEAEPIAHVTAGEIAPADWAAMAAGQGILTGPPAPQVRVRIVDDEILVTGPNVNKGYLDPAQDAATKVTDDAGEIWHRTGDAGRLDAQGRLWLLGRLEGRVGGLFPFGVEAVARQWPHVESAALYRDETGQPLLVLTGPASSLDDWRQRARAIGIGTVVHLEAMPLDRRHASKIEYVQLRAVLARLARRR
ncbi:AMP-binding protein [Bradyrhizobium sp. U87765 SZCCT0131]|uniref:AMP-binding protein n=1 Tax=unclassified Bradyrhizobium TaxID=2631580 RepID=UPI001BAA5A7B|nr:MULTISPECIES: AMP-binding protein [unclassified Bradyrhizobium]MBR1221818.1 AMP-binding protein [Bradyrhizobium sp. U87765 SZCCT0131]MBR1263984.1 AMP-binding protein [Bradyrhizobium sp. U87765 SZCCT0134]MBR1308233.1 AMP-binding protein [Bradyrhizobium sp. U87765 SZCCT0110]MBR1320234.1 AMP-binding protein [Bradyrhizobium sp. U87765 SZCCT0109]MBR1348653.1 AMP-binding protein [Bradyrhizobium sp. U87765 SZCCT0048]